MGSLGPVKGHGSFGGEPLSNRISRYNSRLTAAEAANTALDLRVDSVESPYLIAYGAGIDPTGVSDSRAAIQAKLDALLTTGGTLVFPPGTYNIGSPGLNVDSITKGLTLTGASVKNSTGTVLRYTASGAGKLISADSSNGLRITGLTLQYNHATYTGNLVSAARLGAGADVTNLTIDNCLLFGATSASKSAASLIYLTDVHSSVIDNCQFAWADKGIRLANASFANNVSVTNNQFVLASITTRDIDVAGSFATLVVQGNTFEGLINNTAGAFYANTSVASYALHYAGNWHGDAGVGGTWLKIDHSADGIRGGHIAGNRFEACGAGGVDISISYCEGLAIVGNNMQSATCIAFPLATASRGVFIAGNDFAGATALSGAANISSGSSVGNDGLDHKVYNGAMDFITLRATGSTAPSSGSGAELTYSAGAGGLIAYNRTGSAYLPVWVDGLSSELRASGTTRVKADGTGLGFYGTAPIAKPTGVAVTAGGIHAALVSLGLIAA